MQTLSEVPQQIFPYEHFLFWVVLPSTMYFITHVYKHARTHTYTFVKNKVAHV